MLKKRLITAGVLIPIFVSLVLLLPPIEFAILTMVFVLIGAWEWCGLAGIKRKAICVLYIIALFFLMKFSLYLPTDLIVLLASLFWLIAGLLIYFFPSGRNWWGNSIILRSLMGVMVLIPAWRALNFIRGTDWYGANNGPYLVLFLSVLIWGADSGAYFAGKKWGKHKLAPAVSPGKTWQGLAGALATTALFTLMVALWNSFSVSETIMLTMWSLLTVVFSVIGDLFESMLKRNVGVKDSGNLLPGHGGILDRIDSLTSAAPILVLGMILEKIFH